MKYLFWILIIVIAVQWFRRQQHKKQPFVPKTKEEDMVKCVVCGLNMPQSDAVFQNGHAYCSVEHLSQGTSPRE